MTKEISKWADSAMFEAAPMASQTPKVHLISMTPDPLGALAAAAKMYKGEVVRSLAEVTDKERLSYFNDLTKTTLNAAFETIDFHFLIEGVTRGFTHQLVRQRTAVYFQESTRFAVVDDLVGSRVGLPPSLAGTQPALEYGMEMAERGLDWETNTGEAQKQRLMWDSAIEAAELNYKKLVESGMPAEDARGLLPTNLLTFVHYKTNLRNLIQHAGTRLCTQAQFEWRYVFSEIARAIRTARVTVPAESDASVGRGRLSHISAPVYMADQISDRLFRPVCYQTGNCAFLASFDRHCQIRERVLAFHSIGVPPSDWGSSSHVDGAFEEDGSLPNSYVKEGVVFNQNEDPAHINPIHPAEWMLDPSAARA